MLVGASSSPDLWCFFTACINLVLRCGLSFSWGIHERQIFTSLRTLLVFWIYFQSVLFSFFVSFPFFFYSKVRLNWRKFQMTTSFRESWPWMKASEELNIPRKNTCLILLRKRKAGKEIYSVSILYIEGVMLASSLPQSFPVGISGASASRWSLSEFREVEARQVRTTFFSWPCGAWLYSRSFILTWRLSPPPSHPPSDHQLNTFFSKLGGGGRLTNVIVWCSWRPAFRFRWCVSILCHVVQWYRITYTVSRNPNFDWNFSLEEHLGTGKDGWPPSILMALSDAHRFWCDKK